MRFPDFNDPDISARWIGRILAGLLVLCLCGIVYGLVLDAKKCEEEGGRWYIKIGCVK